MPGGSRLDYVYRSILMTKFFTKGWGKPENLKRLFAFKEKVSNRDTCYTLVPRDYPVTISKYITHFVMIKAFIANFQKIYIFWEDKYSDCTVLEGHFLSPFATYLPGIVPKESEIAHFQVVLPRKWNSDHYKPICLHLAGTGDHGFWRRRQMMAKPLLKEGGIASVILENPFYGSRKPKDQVRSSLHNVSDIIVMGGCLILESLVLFHWCEKHGLGPLGVTGMSMGGHMASLAATNWPKPIVLVPCLSWSSATPVFTQGVMSYSINWELLGSQYFADDVFREEFRKFIRVDKDAFRAGQHFAKHYPYSLEHVRKLSRERNNVNEIPLVTNGVSRDGFSTKPQERIEQSMSSRDAVTGSSNMAVATNFDNSSSGKSNVQVVARSTSMSPDSTMGNLVTGVADTPSINTNVPEPQIKDGESETGPLSNLLDNIKERVSRWREDEALLFMHGIMDECTHLRNFTVPFDTSLIIAICAKDDAYVPREGCADLTDIWPGAEVRFLDAGHVSAYLLHKHTFR
ncbi:Protein ABHD18 [Blattella germanica]|nr:Protein ABHD18 [Blattella germanica]